MCLVSWFCKSKSWKISRLEEEEKNTFLKIQVKPHILKTIKANMHYIRFDVIHMQGKFVYQIIQIELNFFSLYLLWL
jgi:hypothetical protein